MQRNQRTGLLAAALVVVIVGFVIAVSSGGSKHSGPRTRNFHVVVAGGKPQGGIKKLTANKGDTINLDVRSNVADEIHVHGYDYHKDVLAGGSVKFSFPATIDGVFVIELESRNEQIASLVVKT
jgi:hypothetical protein